MRHSILILLAVAAGCYTLGPSQTTAAEDDSAKLKLIPVDKETIAKREKSLAKSAPDDYELVAYLDCGTQRESTTGDRVKITHLSGQPYKFASEAKDVLPTQPTVFFGAREVALEISGIDRRQRYMVGLTWWDYDDGQRTQSVVIGSPDGRMVRLAVAAIGLPNFTGDGQLPAEKRFSLPAVFARNGRVKLSVRQVTGANTVISELWIWQLKK